MKRSMSERSPSGSSGASSRTSPVFRAASDCTTSSDSLVASAISSGVGSRRSVWRRYSAVRTMRDRAALPRERGEDRLADPPHGVGDELHALIGIEFARGGEQADVALADQIGERQAAVLVFLRHRDHEPQVALDEFLHGVLIAGAHLPRERDLLLLREQRSLGDLVQVLIEDVALVLVVPEPREQTPAPAAATATLRHAPFRRRDGGRGGSRGLGGGLLRRSRRFRFLPGARHLGLPYLGAL